MAEIYDRRSRGEAARIGGVGLKTVRDWELRFNARGPDGLIDGVVRWRLKDLVAERGQDRAEEQNHAPLGQAWDTARRTPRPTHPLSKSPSLSDHWRSRAQVRRHCPRARGWRRSRPTNLQQRRHEPLSAGNLGQRRPRQPCQRYPRPLPLRLEQPHRTALGHDIHRNVKMGASVISRAGWY